jgi:glycosyltransferase involved in cell wall biosynthesis
LRSAEDRDRCRPAVRCDNRPLRILHVIHDFLPRHQAGSEIYAFELCRELAATDHVTVVCADFDPARAHGEVTWRVCGGLPVVEIVNNWRCTSFEDTYRPGRITEQLSHVLDAVQPHVLHVHNLLNLSFDLTAIARQRGIRVVATLHDYTLVCPSGGQRVHRAKEHVCRTIDPNRCAVCFRESPYQRLIAIGRLAAMTPAPGIVGRAARRLLRVFPDAASAAARTVRHAPLFPVTAAHIRARLHAAQQVFDDVEVFVAPSAAIAQEFVQLGVPPAKVHVADYGFRAMRAAPRNGQRQRLRIGFVGTLVWHKGAHVLIDAVRRLPADKYELQVFGDPSVFPDYAADLRSRAAGLPVHFSGAFARDAVSEIYSRLDVLVVPSLWLENSPLVIHEAFMAGVAVVASRIGGIAGLIEHGHNGLLFDPGSVDALADSLLDLIVHRDRVGQLARSAPTPRTIADDARGWRDIYEGVIADAPAVGA